MDLEYITRELAKIEAMKGDYEMAHSVEDALRAKFIAHVAKVGPPELALMANELLESDNIVFDRHCA